MIKKMKDETNMQKKSRRLVKETKVLCLVRDVPESHHNCNILFNLIQINLILSKYSLDNKLINIIIGMQSNSAKFPCPFAECYKDKEGKWNKRKLRTIQSCKKRSQSYQEYSQETGDKTRKKL